MSGVTYPLRDHLHTPAGRRAGANDCGLIHGPLALVRHNRHACVGGAVRLGCLRRLGPGVKEAAGAGGGERRIRPGGLSRKTQ